MEGSAEFSPEPVLEDQPYSPPLFLLPRPPVQQLVVKGQKVWEEILLDLDLSF